MVQLYFLTLACVVGFAAAQNTALFSEKCCSKKNVGGVAYTQVPGDTTDFPNCKPDCVYERDDSPNSRFCFRTGKKPVMCTESTSSAQVVFVTRENGKLSFESPGLSHSCDIGSQPTDSEKFEEITCTHIGSEHQASETAETATLISSLSSTGSLEWISLQTDDLWIYCMIGVPPRPCISIIPFLRLGEKNVLYVEGAKPITNQHASENDQLVECSDRCKMNLDICVFWSFSYLQDRTTTPSTHSHSRNHDDQSECGLRRYDACCLIETNANQWFGTPYDFPDTPNIQQGVVAVWKMKKGVSNYECYTMCNEDSDCTTWTWEMEQQKCSRNNYIPTRKISIEYVNNPPPYLYSGCIDRPQKGFKCTDVTTSGGYQGW